MNPCRALCPTPFMPMVAIVLSLLVAGCAAGPAAGPDAETDAPIVVRCTRDAPIGSNIAVRRCRSEEDIRRDAEAARSAGDAIGRAKSGIRGPTGQ